MINADFSSIPYIEAHHLNHYSQNEEEKDLRKKALLHALLLASGGGADSIKQVFAMVLGNNSKSEDYFRSSLQEAIEDDTRARASGLDLRSLKRLASEFPGLSALVTELESAIAKNADIYASDGQVSMIDIKAKLEKPNLLKIEFT